MTNIQTRKDVGYIEGWGYEGRGGEGGEGFIRNLKTFLFLIYNSELQSIWKYL